MFSKRSDCCPGGVCWPAQWHHLEVSEEAVTAILFQPRTYQSNLLYCLTTMLVYKKPLKDHNVVQ